MENSGFAPPIVARHKLEDAWRRQLERTRDRYHAATKEYRKLLRQEPEGHPPAPGSALDRSRHAESEALAEYARVLRIFTDLTVHGKLPVESPGERSQVVTAESLHTVSVVDDDESIRDSTRTLLRSAGYQVKTFESAEIFLDSGAIAETECIVLDLRMPGMSGLELQRRLIGSHPAIPIVFLTAHDDARSRKLAIDGGAVDFLSKPIEANTLVSAVQTALARHTVNRLQS
jgi:CheY-like chemotaxis protein